MKKISLLLFTFLITSIGAFCQVHIEKPTLRSKQKAFAILVDADTYQAIKGDIRQYKQYIEAGGLPTYIVSGHFATPDAVKKQILRLHGKKQALEGMVFIGDIPIAMIRNAQHMTSAFKMNEDTFDWYDSSVPSDRFYDDLDLEFQYLKPDSDHRLLHYYHLTPSSKQRLQSDLYSARIRYPEALGGEAHQAISTYLQKVIRADRNNVLDHFTAFTGAAYHSECIVAWKDDQKAYSEDFPFLGQTAQHVKALHFRMDDVMKPLLFEEMQRPELDVLLMRQHGTPNRQYINSPRQPTDLATSMRALQHELFGRLRRAASRQENVDSLMNSFAQTYGLVPSFFDAYNDPTLVREDSLNNAELYIHTTDLLSLDIQPRYLILDACYNGSFHQEDYLAGAYLFTKGKTIAVQGNTRNVLQDKWTMNLAGLLSYGVRIGQVHNQNNYLESHLFGDPTFRFGYRGAADLNAALSRPDTANWRAYLQQDNPVFQAIALKQLQLLSQIPSSELLEYVQHSNYRIVRLQALQLLSAVADDHFIRAIQHGLRDEYELIARLSALFAGKNGSPELIDALVHSLIYDETRKRVQYNVEIALGQFQPDQIMASIRQLRHQGTPIHAEQWWATLVERLEGQQQFSSRQFDLLKNPSAALPQRIQVARTIRNYTNHTRIPDYLALIHATDTPEELRVNLVEALGWFTHSYRKPQIIDGLKQLCSDKLPSALHEEIVQTLKRLNQ